MNILDLLFPKFCILCDLEGEYLCQKCISELSYYHEQLCHVCKQSVSDGLKHSKCDSNLDGVLVVLHYDKVAREILEEFKYKFTFSLAPMLSQMLAVKLSSSTLDVNTAIPVPLHWFKYNKRGFNQAKLLCQNLPVSCKDNLKRVRYTQTQVGKRRSERLRNVHSVFRLKHPLQVKEILLVDDVMTSGATLEECAMVLKASGVRKVFGLVWARD